MRKPRIPKEASGKDSTKILKKKLFVLKKIESILTDRIETESGSEDNIDEMREELDYVVEQIEFINSSLFGRTH